MSMMQDFPFLQVVCEKLNPFLNDDWPSEFVPLNNNILTHYIIFFTVSGVTTKLDYLKDLSIKSVILSPVVDVEKEDLTSISSAFGTLDDLKKLISTAKENGKQQLIIF